jgi:hypothetical protein
MIRFGSGIRSMNMGQLIKFPAKPVQDRQQTSSSLTQVPPCQAQSKYRNNGKVLFFTGVRYERQTALPSQRLKVPVTRV